MEFLHSPFPPEVTEERKRKGMKKGLKRERQREY